MRSLVPHRAIQLSLRCATKAQKVRSKCNARPSIHRFKSLNSISFHQQQHVNIRCALLSSIPQRNEIELNITCNDADEFIPDDETTDELITSINELTKEERMKIHQEKYEAAKHRKELARRKLLSEEWMRLFASSEELFRATLKELNVDIKSQSDSDGRSDVVNSSALADYRSFYLDSLNSFGAALAEQDAESDISLTSFQYVDAFGESPFGYPAFGSMFRTMSERLNAREDLETSLKKNQERYDKAIKALEEEENLLSQVNGDKVSEVDDTVTSNIMDFDELERIESDMNASLLKAVQSSPKEILKQQNKVENAKLLVNALVKRIDNVQKEIDNFKFPMSHDEYKEATNQLVKVSSDIIPDLAKFITSRHSDFEKYRQLEQHTDLTKPHEWYPHSRLDKRKVIFHAGPTNSGKTYNALKRLKQAQKGMYLAPLRLLAAECYENLTSDGVYCSLITGQEQRDVPFSTHRSSTVELADLEQDYDVVVIDEIQMICDSFRGYAWTRALMGVRCKEIHLAGGLEARDIVAKIVRMCGDDFELKTYERFGQLKVQERSLASSSTERGSYSKVQPGDCIVAFTRPDIFAIKREIEKETSYKCCVIYGTLPPLIRAEQARLFNDPNSEYEILVASDAIGMGLNLSIKRVIFNSLFKHNGEQIVQLDHSLVKQIAGRAGRRNSPYPHGEVTCRDPADMKHLRECMSTEITPIEKAGLIPTPSHIQTFDDLLQQYGLNKHNSLHETLQKFSDMATVQGDFFMCRKRALEVVSKWLKDIDGMSTADKFSLCMSPVKESCSRSRGVLMRYVEKHSVGKSPGIHRSMRPKEAKTFHGLSELCSIYAELDLFLWLQSKLPSSAVEEARALKMKEETIEMINKALTEADKLSLEKFDYVFRDNSWRKMWAQSRRESNVQ